MYLVNQAPELRREVLMLHPAKIDDHAFMSGFAMHQPGHLVNKQHSRHHFLPPPNG